MGAERRHNLQILTSPSAADIIRISESDNSDFLLSYCSKQTSGRYRMQIWERIFELINERGLTQKEFSLMTGIAQSTISDWKKKKVNPGAERLNIIAQTLDVSVEHLLGIPERSADYDSDINTDEKVLLELFRSYDTNTRSRLIDYAKKLNEILPSDNSEITYDTGRSVDVIAEEPVSDVDLQIRKDLTRRLRRLARLSRIRLDETEHASGLNLHLLKYLDSLGLDRLQFIKNYLSNLQPYMISEIKTQERFDNAICVLDEFYRISVYIKVDATKNEEIIVSFHENNRNGISRRNSLIRRDELVYVFADSVGSHVEGTDSYSINLFIIRGVKSFHLNIPARSYDADGFLVRESDISNALTDIVNRYLEDLYTADLDFSDIELFSSLQQLSFTSYGNDVFSNISLLIDSLIIQKDSIGRQTADAAMCIYCNNIRLLQKDRQELLETLKMRYAVNSVKVMPQILERVGINLGSAPDN